MGTFLDFRLSKTIEAGFTSKFESAPN